MDSRRWQQIDELLDAALEISPERRDEFLSAKCLGDEELRREVLSLLTAKDHADGFLETSAVDVIAREIARDSDSAPLSLVGTQLGTYTIEKPIGSGGMGEIYLAHDSRLNRKVAIKILPREFLSHPERVKRFELESRAVALLNHPYIVTIHDVGIADGVSYIATEFIDGVTARELIERGLNVDRSVAIVLQVCEALSAAHSAGIIHRDIKPENIMVRSDGYAKVLDFGLAKLNAPSGEASADASGHTVEGAVIGTPAFMSPEQIAGEKVDRRTDLWSIGVVLYQLLTGNSPFKKGGRQETFRAVLSESPPPPHTINANVPAALERVVLKSLEKEPDLRYQTAEDLRADLKRIQRDLGMTSAADEQRRFPTKPKTRRTAAIYLGVGFAILVAVGLAAWILVSGFNKSSAPDWTAAARTQLTDRAGTEMFPTLAPDGKSFVFVARSERGDFDLFSQRVGDKTARNITENSPADDTHPAFSPDGDRIAFRSEREPKGIYVASATGENIRRVTDFGFHPAWSPNGRELIVSTFGKDLPDFRNPSPSELWIVDLETGARRFVTGGDAMQPAWSPDGRFVAFWFFPPNVGRRDIGIVPSTGGDPIVITKDGTTNWNPVWSPDGKFLYFASDRGGTMGFWRVAFEEGGIVSDAEPVVTPAKFSRHLSFSKDGKRMIFVSTDNRSNLQSVGFDPRSEKTVGEPQWVTQGDREIVLPELSPDGARFVYQLTRRTQDDIVIIDRDGSNPRDLTNDAAFDRYPRWSPDGKRVAFVSDRSGFYEVWTINVDGTDMRQVTFTGTNGTSFPVWSPDGGRLLFRTSPNNFLLETGRTWSEQQPELLPDVNASDGARFVAWDWSPDGRRLTGSFSGAPMSVGFYSFDDGRYLRVGPVKYGFPTWLPDSRRIIYGLEGRIFVADFDSQRPREIDLPTKGDIRHVRVSRDGKLVYYTVFSSESDIWLLDNSATSTQR